MHIKQWKTYPVNLPLQAELAEALSVSPILAHILVNRGLSTVVEAKAFLLPSMQAIHADHDSIPGLLKAAEIVAATIRENKKILVYGDYDVDGITGTTLLVAVINSLGGQASYYIPHRFEDGYGLNKRSIKKAADQGVGLMITIDCGISNVEEVRYANECGMPVIITDHHTPPASLPDALAIVNPKLGNASSFYYHLAGVGVAFKLAEVLLETIGHPDKTELNNYLDLVALGTIADIVPLLGANRILAAIGIQVLNEGKRIGIKMLNKISNFEEAISAKSIAFTLGPRLNAAGRMDYASVAVNLLLTEEEGEALQLATKLNDINEQRRKIGELIKEDAINILENEKRVDQQKVIVLKEQNWHPGIIGIVASQLAKKYSKPTALIAINNGMGRGSIRSIGGIDIYAPLLACQDLLVDFGGHREAAGFEINEESIAAFQRRFEENLSLSVKPEELTPSIHVDADLDASSISPQLLEELDQLSPYGQGNPSPLFSTGQLSAVDHKLVGNGLHIKMTLTDRRRVFEAIGFNLSHCQPLIKSGPVDVAYHLEMNDWNGRRSLQLNIVDIKEPSPH